ncbi:tetratricopeptide repeat protein [Kibdelosporangium philippinense]|uniref:Tetratricopeptide repeat protein n=1 Tax=Kibdelosporangium philippinense TaxID=211113 RepID=A0ABS8ZRR3_9PSEU|nr:BTAD domain-containing putative transcriptional regulator [Kibdelosporangium philippinense]MCE7010409.1 tetratricopeptide repeat protein [Kibdelosporangium philippinense]
MTTVRFRVLGTVSMEVDGTPVALGGAKPRALLAALLVHPERMVDTSALIDVVWGTKPPSSARGMIQSYVSTLRRAIRAAGAPDVLRGDGSGYWISVKSGVDLTEFENAVENARDMLTYNRPKQAAAHLRGALELWRGQAFDGVTNGLLGAEAARLTELRMTALELRVTADLRSGDYETLIPDLRGLVAKYPLRERLWASLMLALHHTGQNSAALAVYESIRRKLADEYGARPGTWLRQAHETVLREGMPDEQPTNQAATIPMQLPADLTTFSGRRTDLARLDRLNARTIVIAGPGGVGKTALAVHWAHRVRSRFPDGQLFVDLRGYDTLAPVSTAQALTQFLRALGTPAQQVPVTVDEQVALYRSMTAGRKLLVVLDNAVGPDQVRALLPSNPDSMTLVTSRGDLRTLTVHNDARVIRLDVLSENESLTLLRSFLGAVDDEPMEELARLCGYLPLALRIVAANLLGSEHGLITDYVERLRADRLAELAVDGDPSVAVRSTFHLSYQALDEPTRRLFRLLGRVPGADFTVPVACAATGEESEAVIRRALDRLVAANLLTPRPGERFQFHDLIRDYAADRARTEETTELAACDRRLLDYYTEAITDAPAYWLDDERANLAAMVGNAASSTELCHYASQITLALRKYFVNRGHAADGLAMCEAALAAAQRSGDQRAEAAVLTMSGLISYNLSDYQRAIVKHTRARDVAKAIGDLLAEADAVHHLGRVHSQLGQPHEAMRCHEAELALAEKAANDVLRARAINYIGVAQLSLGHVEEAVACHSQALAICEQIGDQFASIYVLNGLGLAHWTAGRLTEAANCHKQCVDIAYETEYHYLSGNSLVCLAETYCDLGRYAEARSHAHDALVLSRQIGERRYEAGALEISATVQRRLGKLTESIEGYTAALALSRSISFRYGEVSVLIGLSIAHRRLGEIATAMGYAREALDTMYETGMRVLEAPALTELAASCLAMDDIEHAGMHIEHALKLVATGGQRLFEARALHVRGLITQAARGAEAAVPHWQRALEIFTEIGAPETEELVRLVRSAVTC